jgi:hypothetical protein
MKFPFASARQDQMASTRLIWRARSSAMAADAGLEPATQAAVHRQPPRSAANPAYRR